MILLRGGGANMKSASLNGAAVEKYQACFGEPPGTQDVATDCYRFSRQT